MSRKLNLFLHKYVVRLVGDCHGRSHHYPLLPVWNRLLLFSGTKSHDIHRPKFLLEVPYVVTGPSFLHDGLELYVKVVDDRFIFSLVPRETMGKYFRD